MWFFVCGCFVFVVCWALVIKNAMPNACCVYCMLNGECCVVCVVCCWLRVTCRAVLFVCLIVRLCLIINLLCVADVIATLSLLLL